MVGPLETIEADSKGSAKDLGAEDVSDVVSVAGSALGQRNGSWPSMRVSDLSRILTQDHCFERSEPQKRSQVPACRKSAPGQESAGQTQTA